MDHEILTFVAQTAIFSAYVALLSGFFAVLVKEWKSQFLTSSSIFFILALFCAIGPRAFIAPDQHPELSFPAYAFVF